LNPLRADAGQEGVPALIISQSVSNPVSIKGIYPSYKALF
jgi:hypothetical protein